MKQINKSDNRFTTIKYCKIRNLWRKIPTDFGGYNIDIAYKDKEEDFFSQYISIEIDQFRFLSDIINIDKLDKDERLYYTHGMTDIDIFKSGNDYLIYYSPNDGMYIHLFFKKDEFKKLINWAKLELKK